MADEDVSSEERKKLEQALRDAGPRILKENKPLFGSPPQRRRIEDEVRRIDYPQRAITITPPSQPFPPESATATTAVASASVPNIAFILSNASTVSGNVTTYKVHVFDGEIDLGFPTGMGGGNFVVTLLDPNDSVIYAGIEFSPDTLAITDRFVRAATTSTFPMSRVVSQTSAFAYWRLGYTSLDGISLKIVNQLVGDINPIFVYGSKNNKPALFVFPDIGGLNLDALFP